MVCKGYVHKYGDHIDTDVIIPARTLSDPNPESLALHCMEDIDKEFINRVKSGDILVGGINFGCGSSREHAPIAIKASGISCVVACNFARIFYRNAINIGLPVFECTHAAQDASTGDVLEVDLNSGTIKNLTKNRLYQSVSFPEFMQNIIDAGGLVNYINNRQR